MKNQKYYTIDFEKLVEITLPHFFRKPRLMAFLGACIYPIKQLYGEFIKFTEEKTYEAEITPQSGSIERALNDSFDPVLRRFQIVHALLNSGPILYLESDQRGYQGNVLYMKEDEQNTKGWIMHMDTENKELPIGIDFRVMAPLGYQDDEVAISSIVSKYKYASKKFDVEYR